MLFAQALQGRRRMSDENTEGKNDVVDCRSSLNPKMKKITRIERISYLYR